ncbi:MAG: ABC transporter ATP-binding protein [Chloroflexota bacterium]
MTESAAPARGATALLELRQVTRHFGGIQAVNDLTIVIPSGVVFGLIGPNGAGKTTVINLITGLLRPSAGVIRLDGEAIHTWPTHRIAGHGVSRTFQNIRLFRDLSVLENVIVGQHLVRPERVLQRIFFSQMARAEEQAARERALSLLERVGLAAHAETRAGDLAYGDQRRLEIARALATGPRLLLLDEPAAGMPLAEYESLVTLIRSLLTDGLTVLLVEHNMQVVMNVCDEIAVLNFGRKIAQGTPAEIERDSAVIEAYLGPSSDSEERSA